ncbi:hypothetical protein Fcan01_11874 [Folsomia candida]|uniref:HAT C-terminal dimerisation domain-containing protein n=1 Tax=Folsomia candida TaxID=158441 RepID=A0A226EAK4_FOLCA|nr:hypothetical protein Fcan01_11874 [Folsomia candida]
MELDKSDIISDNEEDQEIACQYDVLPDEYVPQTPEREDEESSDCIYLDNCNEVDELSSEQHFEPIDGLVDNHSITDYRVATNNCNKMIALRQIIKQNFPEIETVGCNSNLLTQCGSHFTPVEIKLKVNEVKANLPGSTRWNSQIESFLNYVKNHGNYLSIVRDLTKRQNDKHMMTKLKNILEILNDSDLFNNIESCIAILQPFCIALDADKNLGLEWISSHSNYLIQFFGEIQKSESEFFFNAYLNPDVKKQMNPFDWWTQASTSAVPIRFLEMVKVLFLLPAGTSGIERCFSTMGNIITKQRNRLTVEKATKLCCVNGS